MVYQTPQQRTALYSSASPRYELPSSSSSKPLSLRLPAPSDSYGRFASSMLEAQTALAERTLQQVYKQSRVNIPYAEPKSPIIIL